MKNVNLDYLINRYFTLAFTNGCFDLLHIGHVKSLEFAKKTADKLIVAINSDTSVKKLKGPTRPIECLQDRMEKVSALSCVDFVISFDDDDPYELIKIIRPDVMIKGQDWEGKTVIGSDVVRDIRFCPLYPGVSTTEIIKRLKK
jgi:D-beta-D-heptose 7-phosphate kinase/D-beta-D-heptose 1-phosphate adenosyltransferase